MGCGNTAGPSGTSLSAGGVAIVFAAGDGVGSALAVYLRATRCVATVVSFIPSSTPAIDLF